MLAVSRSRQNNMLPFLAVAKFLGQAIAAVVGITIVVEGIGAAADGGQLKPTKWGFKWGR